MVEEKKIAVVIPAYNEEAMIATVITTMPDFVDMMIVVDDASADNTVKIVQEEMLRDARVKLIVHENNAGVGAAIATGYKRALADGMDIVAVMAGDGQMPPEDLYRFVEPVALGETDYTKGNRLFRGESWNTIPKYRYFGNAALSLMTKIASGYWHIADFQSGYTAISKIALERLDLDKIYPRYGMPNDLLIKLNIHNFRVRDISTRPVYHQEGKSGIRLHNVIPKITWLLCKGFIRRLFEKYVIRDFHPLVFFYMMGMLLFPLGLLFGLFLFFYRIFVGPVEATSAMFASLVLISGLQTLFFAMWFDMDYNRNLK